MTGSTTGSEYRWPQDYIVLDDGRLRVRPDCLEGFRSLGWTSLERMLTAENVELIRRLDARDNCRVRIPTDGGTVRGYLKRHRVRTLRRRMLERSPYRAARSPGMNEAQAVAWCRSAGVPTMSILAAGEQINRFRRSDSFFMSAELTGHVAANEFWFPADRRSNPPGSFAVDSETRKRILCAVACTGRRLHAAGLVHLDFYLQHFLIDNAAAPTAALIDLQRVERHLPGRGRRIAVTRDLAQFFGSTTQFQLTSDERKEWLRWYFGDESGPREPTRSDDRLMRSAARRWRRRQLKRTVRRRRAA